jgi:hypothetical protein
MDPQSYQQMMIQALMGGMAQPGMQASGQNPSTPYGQSFMTGNPTVPGGMLGTGAMNPNQGMNPMQGQMGGQQGGQMAPGVDPNQLQQAFQTYPGMMQQAPDMYSGSGSGQ